MTDSPTPQTRDDGLTEDEILIGEMLGAAGFQPDTYRAQLLRKGAERLRVLKSALLSHKRQGRNEGLEEAAAVCKKQAAMAGQRAAMHDKPEARTAALDKMEAAQTCMLEIAALISPLPKAGD